MNKPTTLAMSLPLLTGAALNQPDYKLLQAQLDALLADDSDVLANTSNFVALLNNALDDINWIGVYVLRGDELVLGPFQGLAACVRIPLGKGVCGTAAKRLETLRVADVHEFPGHIACDVASRSELVVPLVIEDELVGVLDIDSPLLDRFSSDDQAGIEAVCRSFCAAQTRFSL
jgi:GAF domain-containing protein